MELCCHALYKAAAAAADAERALDACTLINDTRVTVF